MINIANTSTIYQGTLVTGGAQNQTLCVESDGIYLHYVTDGDYEEEVGWSACDSVGGPCDFQIASYFAFGNESGQCQAVCHPNVTNPVEVSMSGGPWTYGDTVKASFETYDASMKILNQDMGTGLICPANVTEPCIGMATTGSENTNYVYSTPCTVGWIGESMTDSFCLNKTQQCLSN